MSVFTGIKSWLQKFVRIFFLIINLDEEVRNLNTHLDKIDSATTSLDSIVNKPVIDNLDEVVLDR